MKRLWYLIRRFLGLLPAPRWEDGVVSTDPVYAALYAKTVAWVRSVRPEAIQAPELVATVRIYDRWPKGYEYNLGKVLSPNVIHGDTGGTICLAKAHQHDTDIITHEMRHAITGIPDHPDWLFPTT